MPPLVYKVFVSVCAICGVLCISLPIPIIVNNFNKFYEKSKIEEEITLKKTQSLWDEGRKGSYTNFLARIRYLLQILFALHTAAWDLHAAQFIRTIFLYTNKTWSDKLRHFLKKRSFLCEYEYVQRNISNFVICRDGIILVISCLLWPEKTILTKYVFAGSPEGETNPVCWCRYLHYLHNYLHYLQYLHSVDTLILNS